MFFLLIFLLSTASLVAHSCDQEAQEWAEQFCKNISKQDAENTLQLLYCSYQRSACTLAVQKAWLSDHECSLELGYTIAHTRRNPSRQKNYPHSSNQLLQIRQELIRAYEQFEEANSTYNSLLEQILKGTKRLSSFHEEQVKIVRARARSAIAHALLQYLHELQENLSNIQEKMSNSSHSFHELIFLRPRSIRFLTYLWDYFPQIMVRSFISFDDQFTQMQHICAQVFYESYAFSNHVWQIIETERKAFYYSYYTALKNIFETHVP